MRPLLRLTLVFLVVVAFTSCRSKREIYVPKRERPSRVDRHDIHGDKQPTASDWTALNVALTDSDNKQLYDELRQWLGTPYRYAASEKGQGTDCSGLVMQVYQSVFGIGLERNSARMFEKNCREIGRHRLREADLVFFNNGSEGRITHVGIYLKEGYFVHASSSRGVIVSNLSQNYYDTHFQCAGRVRK